MAKLTKIEDTAPATPYIRGALPGSSGKRDGSPGCEETQNCSFKYELLLRSSPDDTCPGKLGLRLVLGEGNLETRSRGPCWLQRQLASRLFVYY